MKTKILLMLLLIASTLVIVSCEKDKIEFADENIIVNNEPSLSVYKTNNDYFNYINVSIDTFGNVTSYPVYYKNSMHIANGEDGKYKYTQRWQLQSGYIIDKEIEYNDAFTDVTFSEQIEYEENNSSNVTGNWYQQRIIDTNPFKEYYWLGGLNDELQEFTLYEINEMIEKGTLETVFTKIK